MSKLDTIIDNPAGCETVEEALIEYLNTYEEYGQVMVELLKNMECQETDEIALKCLADLLKCLLNMTI